MEDVELSVQELSNKTGKSIQSIYKRIKNKNDTIQGFLKKDNEGNIIEPVKIFSSVIDVIYNKNNNATKLNTKPSSVQFSLEGKKEENKQEQIGYIKAIEVLQEQLRVLQNELQAEREDKQQKDKLIFELNERLAESQRNLDQQQRLSIADKKKILMLEEKSSKPLHQRFLDIFRKENRTNNGRIE